MNLDFREKYVSRDVSSGLKGVAIMLMLFLHLFNNPARDAGMGYLLSVDGQPLCWWLSRFCSVCVPLYMFLSGYGLWIIHRRGGRMRNGRRVLLLWLNVAVVGVLFYPWSALRPELHWRFDAAGILATFTGFNPYNAEWWFLFPWVFVCLLSPWVFRLMERWGTLRVLLLSFAVYFGLRYAIQWYGADRLAVGSARFAYEAMQVAILLFPFLLGSAAARHGVLAMCKRAGGYKDFNGCFDDNLFSYPRFSDTCRHLRLRDSRFHLLCGGDVSAVGAAGHRAREYAHVALPHVFQCLLLVGLVRRPALSGPDVRCLGPCFLRLRSRPDVDLPALAE